MSTDDEEDAGRRARDARTGRVEVSPPEAAERWLELGLEALAAGAQARALDAFTEACRADPELVEAH
ncbi:hypothetical protein L6R52_28065, partial [Myxococcota bacterium]|nr:hypothetical protein [Myxococcota bacterium]